MTSELTTLSANDMYPTVQRNKLQGRIMLKRELYLDIESLKIQRVKKNRALKWCTSREDANSEPIKVHRTFFKSSKTVKELDLQFMRRAASEQRRNINDLMRNIKSLSFLQKLNLDLFWRGEPPYIRFTPPEFHFSRIQNDTLHKMSKVLKGQVPLQTFSLHFINSEINDDGLLYLSRILKRMANLKTLSLGFSQSVLFTGAGLEAICKRLKRITFLETINFDLSKCTQITMSHLQLILQNLQGVPFLHTVNIRLSEWSQRDNLGQKNLHFDLKQSTSFKHLNLNFSDFQINDREVEDLSLVLKKLTFLENLTLNFTKCSSFTEDGLQSLSKSLHMLINLKSLNLYFHGCWLLNDTGLNVFAASLKKLTSLQILRLDLSGSETSFQSNLASLKRCRNLTLIGLNHLIEALKDLLCLQSIGLNFASCNQINNKALDSIANALEKLVSLQKISLNFSGCSVSNVGFQKINEALDKLPSLKHVKLEK